MQTYFEANRDKVMLDAKRKRDLIKKLGHKNIKDSDLKKEIIKSSFKDIIIEALIDCDKMTYTNYRLNYDFYRSCNIEKLREIAKIKI